MYSQSVTKVMSADPVSVQLDAGLGEARKKLTGAPIHHLPVVSGKKLVGLLSTTDLLRVGMQYESSDTNLNDFLDAQFSIADVMQKHPISLPIDSTLKDAATMLSAGGFHAVPIVDGEGNLVGIVTTTDLVDYLVTKL